VLSAVIPSLGQPIIDEVGRAELAAEGRPFAPNSPMGRCANELGRALGFDEVIVVRNDTRPYTVDVFRKSTPVITLGTRLVDEFSLGHLSFLIASCLVPVAFGGLPLRFTPAGRAIDDGVLTSLLGGVFGALGFEIDLREREQANANRVASLINENLKPGDLARLRPYSQEAYLAVGAIGIPTLRQALEAFTARIALVLGYSFGGAMEALRRLNFDDRPRSGLSEADLLGVLNDNVVLGGLLSFAGTPTCLALRAKVYGGDTPPSAD
ncbi:MAG: hypothetical protein VX589_11200, partial [Myxococcota bacterium]|nr:hypothetical protein [Myxococcota bacterium]